MSQEYDDHRSSELMEWRVGVPLSAASFFIGLRIVENLFSKSPWSLDRAFRLGIACAFLLLILWSWRIIRKDLKTLNWLCDANCKPEIEARASQSLCRSVAGVVSLYSSVITMILLAFLALQKI